MSTKSNPWTLEPGQETPPTTGNSIDIAGDGDIRAKVTILGSNQSQVKNNSPGAPITVRFS